MIKINHIPAVAACWTHEFIDLLQAGVSYKPSSARLRGR